MNFKKKAAMAIVIGVLALLYALPATRDELDWYWISSRDDASDYLQYSSDWPKGRHAAEAKLRYDQRTWANTKRAMINEAVKKNKAATADPDSHLERKVRLEHFLWKQVTNENTAFSYKDYLQRYPAGEFASEARQKLAALGGSGGTNATVP